MDMTAFYDEEDMWQYLEMVAFGYNDSNFSDNEIIRRAKDLGLIEDEEDEED